MTRVVPWITALAMLVAAWFVAGATPDGEQRLADPFPVTAETGVAVEGDNLAVTVHEVRLADRVSAGGWYAEGVWLVVTIDAALTEREPAVLRNCYLRVGERSFLASERLRYFDAEAAIDGQGLHVGIPQTGSLAFELPEDIVETSGASSATLQLALGSAIASLSPDQNHQGISVIELPVDLTALTLVGEVEITGTEWTMP